MDSEKEEEKKEGRKEEREGGRKEGKKEGRIKKNNSHQKYVFSVPVTLLSASCYYLT